MTDKLSNLAVDIAQSSEVSFLNAAAAGRLVVILLFAANAAAYLVNRNEYNIAGMLLAILAATLGYFACSAAAYAQNESKLVLASIALSLLSGIAFLLGA